MTNQTDHLHAEWIITPAELKHSLSDVKLLDVREPQEYAASYIEGSTHIPLGEVMARAEAELDKKDDIVIYCAHGVRSLHALAALQRMGFQKVRSLEGGIVSWEEQHGPTCSPG